jgi:hypothetical protein
VTAFEDEVQRLRDDLWRMLYRGGDYASEVPYSIHERGVDSGHGLGGPPFHPRFLSYLRDAGACMCPETRPDGTPQAHTCDRRFEGRARFREPARTSHPRRLKRAFRQLRLLAGHDQYHLVFLVVARGWTLPSAAEHVNSARSARGEEPMDETDAKVMLVCGVDLLTASW